MQGRASFAVLDEKNGEETKQLEKESFLIQIKDCAFYIGVASIETMLTWGVDEEEIEVWQVRVEYQMGWKDAINGGLLWLCVGGLLINK